MALFIIAKVVQVIKTINHVQKFILCSACLIKLTHFIAQTTKIYINKAVLTDSKSKFVILYQLQ